MKRLQKLMLVAVLVFGIAGYASAAPFFPAPDFGDVEGLLSTYFNGYDTVSKLNFEGYWDYTAIAFEAANTNRIKEVSGGPVTFKTSDTSNFGHWAQINFSGDEPNNLQFKDTTDGTTRSIDAYNDATDDVNYWKLFKLTADSDPLGWLGNLILPKGTIIVGWNDNSPAERDTDFDDIIVAMKPVPEPATILLMGAGLLGLVGLRRKFKK